MALVVDAINYKGGDRIGVAAQSSEYLFKVENYVLGSVMLTELIKCL